MITIGNRCAASRITRWLPAIVMWVFSSIAAICSVWYVGFVLWNEAKYRWIESDPDSLDYFHERLLSPPVIAWCISCLIAAAIGFIAAVAWRKGSWYRAIAFTVAFFLLAAISEYVKGNR